MQTLLRGCVGSAGPIVYHNAVPRVGHLCYYKAVSLTVSYELSKSVCIQKRPNLCNLHTTVVIHTPIPA